ARWMKSPSASGERQMFPMQTKRILIMRFRIRFIAAARRGAAERLADFEELAQLFLGEIAAHEALADEYRVHALRGEQLHVASHEDARFRDEGDLSRHQPPQAEGRVERDLEGAQVPVVDADQRRTRAQRGLRLALVVYLGERREAKLAAQRDQVAQPCLLEAGGDQQVGARAEELRLEDLVGLGEEILAQGGQRDAARDLAEVVVGAEEEILLRQHRE